LLTVAGIAPAAALTYATEAGHAWILPQALALQEAGPDVVAESHAAGVRVGTWTVDDPEVMGTLFGWGVDAVATNDPGRGVAVRDGGSGQD
jgi:glycerophosphoryl diester phosphodiesterase